MDLFRIQGGKKLKGHVKLSGAKNSTLPILCACLLNPNKVILDNVPDLKDVRFMLNILEEMGASTSFQDKTEIHCEKITPIADYDLVRKMRASILVLGPLLSRFGQAKVSLPGGCAIGARPIDLHLSGLEKMGAEIKLDHGYVIARAKKLKGAHISFAFPSVGATENLMMAAVLAEGETILDNAAREPEIIDLAHFLKKAGAQIQGEGTSTIKIVGVKELKSCEHSIITDRIEAATFLVAAAFAENEITLSSYPKEILASVEDALNKMGVQVIHDQDRVRVQKVSPLKGVEVQTEPFPGFPTDVQAQLMILMCLAKGKSTITETIFENRYMHVPELKRMGAKIELTGKKATIEGIKNFVAAPVMATDLRASASLVLAGTLALGETIIQRVYHIDRGYERIEDKFNALGAKIIREQR